MGMAIYSAGQGLKCKTFPSTNQIAQNVYKDEKLEFIKK